MDDPRIRRSLGLALDRDKLFHLFGVEGAYGGVIPPGIPGHSPDIGLRFNTVKARKLLAEAGYPGGDGFPPLVGLVISSQQKIANEITRQWRANLGIEVKFEVKNSEELVKIRRRGINSPLLYLGWIADYPDPDNLLGQPNAILDILHLLGWFDLDYDKLVKEAARSTNRKNRMSMYRQADWMLVHEQVVVMPIIYGGRQSIIMIKPWVTNFLISPAGLSAINNVIIKDH